MMPMFCGPVSRALLATLLLLLPLQFGGVRGACTRTNCLPPDCFCASLTGPPEIRLSETPQMVLLSFDDAVLPEFERLYARLFSSGRRRNPNGCPITATFYVTHDGTDYQLVNQLYAAGHEMASHSVSHRLPQSNWTRAPYQQWLDEIAGQRDNLVGITRSYSIFCVVMFCAESSVVGLVFLSLLCFRLVILLFYVFIVGPISLLFCTRVLHTAYSIA